MIKYILSLFRTTSKSKKLDYNKKIEEINKKIDYNEKIMSLSNLEEYREIEEEFIKNIKDSIYITEFIRSKTLERIELLKPITLMHKEGFMLIKEKIIDYFIKSENIALYDLLNNITILKNVDLMIENEKKNLDERINSANETIEKIKKDFSNILGNNS